MTYEQMRTRKLWICVLLALILILNAVGLGWSCIDAEPSSIATYTLYLCYSLYALVVAARSVNQDTTDYHCESFMHLTALTTFASVLLVGLAILPVDSPVAASIDSIPALKGIWYAAMVLYIVTATVVVITPTGPSLHYPPEAIYTEKTVLQATNTDKENVTGVIGASAWDSLLFSYTTKVVMLGNIAESLEIGDLPVIPASMRATFNYTKMKKAMRDTQLRIRNWQPKPGSGWNLGYKLLVVNRWGFSMQFLLAATAAVMFYMPPIFLEKLVKYLETDPERHDRSWGWVYVAGLFATSVTGFLRGSTQLSNGLEI